MIERLNQLEQEVSLLQKENDRLRTENNYFKLHYNHSLDEARWFRDTAEYFGSILHSQDDLIT